MNRRDEPAIVATPARRLLPIVAGAGLGAVAARFLTSALDASPTLAVWIPALTGVGIITTAIALGWWTPAWPDKRADLLGRVTWTMSRLVPMVLAVLLTIAAVSYQPPLPSCPEFMPGVRTGELTYSSMSGKIFVCTYEDRGGSL